MSGPIKNGGPAFPYRGDGDEGGFEQFNGMSLRDYFAGQCLASMEVDSDGAYPSDGGRKAIDAKLAATACYRYADAMIAARNGGAK
jgi:hypothetical protein